MNQQPDEQKSTTCTERKESPHLVKVIQSCMQIGKHACRRFIGDLDGIFQDPLRKTYRINLLPLLPCPCSRNVYIRSMHMLNALRWPFCVVYLRNNVFLGCWCRLSTHKHSVIWMTAFTAALQELLKWAQPTANQVDILQGHEWKIKIYISKF